MKLAKPIPRRRSKPRRGPLRDRGYLAHLRRSACAIAPYWFHRCQGRIEAAHGPVNGMSSKGPDNEAIALCSKAHREQHSIGHRAFQKMYQFDWKRIAKQYWDCYQESKR